MDLALSGAWNENGKSIRRELDLTAMEERAQAQRYGVKPESQSHKKVRSPESNLSF